MQTVGSALTGWDRSSPASAAKDGRATPARTRFLAKNATYLQIVQVDECAEDPCLNDGHCIDLLGDFSCSCPLTWTGRRCEERVER